MTMVRIILSTFCIFADNLTTSEIRILDATTGFRAGQHLRLRAYRKGVFDLYPFPIMRAPSGLSCL